MTIISENERRNELASLKDVKVVQANDLITSVAKMDKIPLKIFELAVSQIDIENPPQNNTVSVSKKQLFAFFNATDGNKHTRFKDAILQLHRQALFFISEEKMDKKKKQTYSVISPLAKTDWNDYSDNIYIKFTDDIMPYLIDLRANFTQYAILDVMNFRSKYSIIIYKLLNLSYNQYEYYADTKLRTKKQLDSYRNPVVPLNELRRITDTQEEYSDFGNFEKRVIGKAIDEINEHTHFNVSYEKMKVGRSIQYIQFFITKKQVAKNEFYKEEQNDEQYAVNKEQQRIKDLEDIRIAISHKYSSKLLHANILTIQDIMSENDLMLELYRTVYELYFELDKYRLLDTHLEYVAKHMQDYSTNKKNLAKYLRVSAQDYIAKSEYLKSLKE